MTSRLAAIDLGSNTLKITVAEAADGTVVWEADRITRVGQGLDDNGFLLDEAMDRTLAGLTELVAEARRLGTTAIRCVGTAGLRGASNAPAFLARVKSELQLDVEIIHGLREAELAFAATSARFGHGPLVVFDVGGRSTELITGAGGQLHERISLELGGVRMTERFLPSDPPTDAELGALFAFLDEALVQAPTADPAAELVGVSGTILSLLGVHLGLDDMAETVRVGEGTQLPLASVEAAFEALRKKPAAERIRGTVIPVGRADVIVAGTAITLAVMRRYGRTQMRVTNRGVRFGLLAEMMATPT